MQPVLIAFGRAVWSQLHFRMLMLTVLPFVLSIVIWGLALWFGLQPMIDWIQAYFGANDGFRLAGRVLGWFNMDAIKAVLVPLIAMWVLLPLMILTALIFVGTMAMPAIVRHVAGRNYPDLEQRMGGSLWGSLWISSISFIVFLVLWLLTLPLNAIPPLTFIVQPMLWGWLTYRVMAYDALADHASEQERKDIMRTHRWPLLMIGTVTGAMGAAPTLLWLGGALAVVLFPLLAAVSIWLYVLVFTFSGLWFQHYCMDALARRRRAEAQAAAEPRLTATPAVPQLKDIN
ncbi:MAG: hypothetical protein JWQ23_839 [Herminiimonas sp.]|nr:hypothetical protein [Herminiimonas sp.]